MGFSLPLNKMTVAEKLATMELLWEDLCQNSDEIPSFPWHQTILAKREQLVADNKATFSDLDDAKARIREATR